MDRWQGRRFLASGWCAASLLATVVAPSPSAAQQRFGELELTALPPFPGERTHGYVEYRVRVANHGAALHQVALDLPEQRDSGLGSYGAMRLHRVVQVPPGATVEVALPQLPMPMWANAVGVRVDGRESTTLAVASSGTFQAGQGSVAASRLLVLAASLLPPVATPPGHDPGDVEEEDKQGADKAGVVQSPAARPAMAVARAELPIAAWSASWLAYSGFDGVALGGDELATAPAAVREALRGYVEAGGVLLVVAPGDAAALLGLPRRGTAAGVSAEDAQSMVRRVGFGTLMLAAGPTLGGSDIAAFDAALVRARQPWTSGRDPQSGQRALPIREAEVPVRGLLVFIIGFVGLVGPVNLFLLARWKRKMWVFATVPALALLATAGVTAYAWLAEGVVRERSTVSLTILDQATRRAATWALCGVYATFTPSEGLRYAADSEVTPLLGAALQSPAIFGVDWTSEQRLVPGWVVARSPLHLLTRHVGERRERLLISRQGDRFQVQNALGAPLERVILQDAGGRIFIARAVAAGAWASLAPFGGAPGSTDGQAADVASEVMTSGVAAAVSKVAERPWEYLQPGTYVAVLAGDPFAEEGLARASTVTARSVVWGRLAP